MFLWFLNVTQKQQVAKFCGAKTEVIAKNGATKFDKL